MTHQKVVKSR